MVQLEHFRTDRGNKRCRIVRTSHDQRHEITRRLRKRLVNVLTRTAYESLLRYVANYADDLAKILRSGRDIDAPSDRVFTRKDSLGQLSTHNRHSRRLLIVAIGEHATRD